MTGMVEARLGASSKLPIMHSDSEQLTAMQTRWSSILGPLLSNPLVNGVVLKQVALASGTNIINHTLGRKIQGYLVTFQDAPASISSISNFSSMPALTLHLDSTAPVNVNLYVY